MFCFSKYKRINENELSLNISRKEGKKNPINIGQIKEVQKILLEELAKELSKGNKRGIIELIKNHQ